MSPESAVLLGSDVGSIRRLELGAMTFEGTRALTALAVTWFLVRSRVSFSVHSTGVDPPRFRVEVSR